MGEGEGVNEKENNVNVEQSLKIQEVSQSGKETIECDS